MNYQHLIGVLLIILSIIGLRLIWFKKDKSEVWGASDVIPRVILTIILTLFLIWVIGLLGLLLYYNTGIGAVPSGR